jgi:hypothetical protein
LKDQPGGSFAQFSTGSYEYAPLPTVAMPRLPCSLPVGKLVTKQKVRPAKCWPRHSPKRASNVAYWPIASFRGSAANCRFRTNRRRRAPILAVPCRPCAFVPVLADLGVATAVLRRGSFCRRNGSRSSTAAATGLPCRINARAPKIVGRALVCTRPMSQELMVVSKLTNLRRRLVSAFLTGDYRQPIPLPRR